MEYYHNSSWLEHGGAPDKAARSGFVSAIDAYLKQNGKYAKNESKITFQDVADCLVLVTNCFSTQTSYENQTKKSINNRFIQEAMTEFFRSRLQVYFLENKQEADRIAEQVLINKRSRETAERAAHHGQKEALRQSRHRQPRAEIRRLPQPRRQPPRAVYRRGRFRHGLRSSSRATRNFRASCPSAAKFSTA